MIVLVYGGSFLLIPVLGIGINLWINQLFWLLGLAVFIAWRKQYDFRETFSVKKAQSGAIGWSAVLGLAIWFPSMLIYTVVEQILTKHVGSYHIEMPHHSPVQLVFLIAGTVVLAPLCEEFFFRGFMQKAYDGYKKRYSWIIVGVLFGVFHVGNGISDVISATALGLLIGYVMYLTNSIWPAVVLHALNNFAAVFLGNIRFVLLESDSIPHWFLMASLISVFLVILSILMLRKKYRGTGNLEEEASITSDAYVGVENSEKTSWSRIVRISPLVLSALIFLGTGFLEVSLRKENEPVRFADKGYSNITIGESREDSNIVLARFYIEDADTYALEWTMQYASTFNDITFRAITPAGNVFYEQGPVVAPEGMTYGSQDRILIEGQGEWLFVMEGMVKAFEIKFKWNLSKE